MPETGERELGPASEALVNRTAALQMELDLLKRRMEELEAAGREDDR